MHFLASRFDIHMGSPGAPRGRSGRPWCAHAQGSYRKIPIPHARSARHSPWLRRRRLLPRRPGASRTSSAPPRSGPRRPAIPRSHGGSNYAANTTNEKSCRNSDCQSRTSTDRTGRRSPRASRSHRAPVPPARRYPTRPAPSSSSRGRARGRRRQSEVGPVPSLPGGPTLSTDGPHHRRDQNDGDADTDREW